LLSDLISESLGINDTDGGDDENKLPAGGAEKNFEPPIAFHNFVTFQLWGLRLK